MKKVVIIISILFITGNMAYAGNFGSPEPTANAGKASLGVGYLYYSSDWKPDDTSFFGIEGVWRETDVKSDQVYIQASFSFVKNWEVYLRFGGADVKVENAFWGLKDFKADFKPFGTAGIKGLVYNKGYFGLGPFVQANYIFQNFKDEISGYVDLGGGTVVFVSDKRKYKHPWDINVGFAFYIKNEGISLYGGPFIYWGKAKIEDEISVSGSGISISDSDSTTYKEKGNLGGYLGVKVPLGEGFNLEVEGQAKKNLSVGAALTYSF